MRWNSRRFLSGFIRLLAFLAPAFSGCGYTFGPLRTGDVRSVEVPIFENDSRRREIEFGLTEAVALELRRAGYRIAQSGTGEAVLSGRIVEVTETVLSEDTAGLPAQSRVTVAASYRLVSRRRSGLILAKGLASEGGEVIFARGQTRETALERSILELARSIVRGLEPPFR